MKRLDSFLRKTTLSFGVGVVVMSLILVAITHELPWWRLFNLVGGFVLVLIGWHNLEDTK